MRKGIPNHELVAWRKEKDIPPANRAGGSSEASSMSEIYLDPVSQPTKARRLSCHLTPFDEITGCVG
jgi:hypothetical protein